MLLLLEFYFDDVYFCCDIFYFEEVEIDVEGYMCCKCMEIGLDFVFDIWMSIVLVFLCLKFKI